MIKKIISIVEKAAMSKQGNRVTLDKHRLQLLLEQESVFKDKGVMKAIEAATKAEQDALLAAELQKKEAEKAAADKDLQKAAATQAAKQAALEKAQKDLEAAKAEALKAAKKAIA